MARPSEEEERARRRQSASISDNPREWPDAFHMTRAEASRFAASRGIDLAVATLARMASEGSGPPIAYFRSKPYYTVGVFSSWLDAQIVVRGEEGGPGTSGQREG